MTKVGKDFIGLEWQASDDNGGSDITGYIVEKKDSRRSMYTNAGTTEKLKLTVGKLTEGVDYFLRVAAENAIGTSDWTETKEAVTAKLPFGKFEMRYGMA